MLGSMSISCVKKAGPRQMVYALGRVHISGPSEKDVYRISVKEETNKLTGSTAVLNSKVPTQVLASRGVKLKCVEGETTTTSKIELLRLT